MKKTVEDVDLKGKRVLMRTDFNVPLDDECNITDDSRIRAALPTIKYILKKEASLILMSHLGRPKGKVVSKMRLDPVAKRLSKLLNTKVKKVDDCIGGVIEEAVSRMKAGDILLLENLRFHPEEEKNDPQFARRLAGLADLFINDAFGTAHRAHASTEGVAKFLPSAGGFLMAKEISFLGGLLTKPDKPFIAILGGAKVSDKIGVIENLLNKVDAILIGGGMCYTFLKAQDMKIGNSKLEENKIDTAKRLLKKARIQLPVDHVIAVEVSEDADRKTVEGDIPDGWIGLDIGPKTIENFKSSLKNAKTIMWNGPLGVFEVEGFGNGTRRLAEFIGGLGVSTIIGGGDTVAAITQCGFQDKMTHISTGGGASLEFLEGKELPGIKALEDR